MTKKSRRKFSTDFKARVVLEALIDAESEDLDSDQRSDVDRAAM